MDNGTLTPDAHRRQLGLGARWLAATSRGAWQQGAGYWWALSGADSSDVNLATLYTADRQTLRLVQTAVQDVGCPAVLSLAGPARTLSGALGQQWSPVGSMPVMAVGLDKAERREDNRVRRATAVHVEELTALLRTAYGIDEEAAEAALQPIHHPDPACAVYTLIEAGTPVSALVAAQAEGSVSIWCMATPPDHARRGYGRALLGDVLARAAAAGADVGLLGATPAGEPLYRSTGWKVQEHWALYVNAPSAQFGAHKP